MPPKDSKSNRKLRFLTIPSSTEQVMEERGHMGEFYTLTCSVIVTVEKKNAAAVQLSSDLCKYIVLGQNGDLLEF